VNALLYEQVQRHATELEQRVVERTAELETAMEKAQEADRLKSAFLAAMSHELRTPLNSIIGFTGILLQNLVGPLNDEQTKQLGMVRDSAQHLLSLINDVLDISKIEAGQLELALETFDVRESIDKVIKTTTPMAEKKDLDLTVRIAPDIGRIVSDRRRVEQILINLVTNAVKFTEKGHVCVECRQMDTELECSVLDSGIGIKAEDMGKLFKAFQQVDTGLTRRYEGTGLGLSICKKLVEMLGGTIRVDSQWGTGSTFTFTLPLN
jgi:signal transduction histidine kinase